MSEDEREKIEALLPEGDSLLPPVELSPMVNDDDGTMPRLDLIDPNKGRYGYEACRVCGRYKKTSKMIMFDRCCCWCDYLCNKCVRKRSLKDYMIAAGELHE